MLLAEYGVTRETEKPDPDGLTFRKSIRVMIKTLALIFVTRIDAKKALVVEQQTLGVVQPYGM